VRGLLPSLTFVLATGAILGAIALSRPALAQAEPVELQENSLQSAIDDFVAYLKSEAYDAASEAARLARDNKDVVDAAKATLHSHLAELGAVLSDQKATVETLASDAAKKLGAWSKSAGVSWAGRSAQDMLDRFTAWLRSQSLLNESSEIPV
jgi:hypothetical protein